jgi:hypothetical protein
MFCPQCGHQQASSDRRFCSNCGLSLGLVTDLLANSSTQLQREKREITGIGMMMATIIMLINFTLIFGAVTLPHLTNPVFFWIWAFFVVSSLSIGGVGLANLIRGGFFKRLKEREMRLNLMKLEEKRQLLPQEAKSASVDVESAPRLAEPVSVTETTTRELQAVPKQKGETSRMKEATAKD